MEIFKEFKFEAAHSLPHLPEGHKCRNLHGHSYRLLVYVKGDVNPETGWIIDFAELKQAVNPVIRRLDHSDLNSIREIGHTTVENLARWIWEQLQGNVTGLSRIEVRETATAGCIYSGS